MPFIRAVLRALPVCALAVSVSAAPALGFQPSVTVLTADPGNTVTATDLSARGGTLVGSDDWISGSDRFVALTWSTDRGASWQFQTWSGDDFQGARDSRVTVCDDHAVMIYRVGMGTPNVLSIETMAQSLPNGLFAVHNWPGSDGARGPDITCVADDEVATAWFKPSGSGFHVRVRTDGPTGSSASPQSFDLGPGSPSRGLSIATSSHRVYVTWFDGSKLKLRRFNIRTSSSHDLTTLGTTTIATLKYGYYPRIGVDGDRVVVSYMDKASLKVRRSTNGGSSFGAAKTLRSEPFPSEIGTYPLTVAVHGSRVAIGAVEVSDGGGQGLGYLSTDGGSSYTKLSQHSSGRVVAALVKVGSTHRYAEAWDETISQPVSPRIRFRRE